MRISIIIIVVFIVLLVEGVDEFPLLEYDDDGNETRTKTSIGIWYVIYNGENRPILWKQGTNTIAMSYDRMGRRVTKNNPFFIFHFPFSIFLSSPPTSRAGNMV